MASREHAGEPGAGYAARCQQSRGSTIARRTAQLKQQAVHAPPRPCSDNSNCETFEATNHAVTGAFRDFWHTHGGLAVCGCPLTEQVSTAHPDSPTDTFLS